MIIHKCFDRNGNKATTIDEVIICCNIMITTDLVSRQLKEVRKDAS